MAIVIVVLFLVSFAAGTSGFAAASSKAPDHVPGRLCNSLSECSRPLAARNDRVDPTDHFRHYHGGFNIRNETYIKSTIYAAGYIMLPLAAFLLVLTFLGMAVCIIPRIHAMLLRDIAYRERLFNTLAALLLLLSIISLISMLSFAVAGYRLFATARNDVVNWLVTSSTLQANEEIRAVAKDLNASAYFLTKRSPGPLSNTSYSTATLSNSTRELLAMIFGAEMRLVGDQSWNDKYPRLQQYRRVSLIHVDIILCQAFVAVALVLVVMGIGMVLGRIYNPRWTWPRYSIYRYVIPLGFVLVSALLTSAVYTFALTKMLEDGADALEEYGPPFNTIFDFHGFLPCAELSTIGERTKSQVQAAIAFIDRNASAIHVNIQQHSNLTVYSAFNPQLNVMLVNASISLVSSVPKIEKLRSCSEILQTVHALVRKQRPRLKTAGTIAWISLVVTAFTFVFLPILWGITRALKRPDRELLPVTPIPVPAIPSVNIPAQPNLFFPRPPIYFGHEDCPRVRQVDIWTDFFRNKDMKSPIPEDN